MTTDAKIMVALVIGRFRFIIRGKGDERLTLSHSRDFVIRKSGFISDRTLMIHADKAANDMPREMVQLLRDPMNKLTVEISTSL